jgi:hypothetical protein
MMSVVPAISVQQFDYSGSVAGGDTHSSKIGSVGENPKARSAA